MQTYSRFMLYSGLSGLLIALMVWLVWLFLSAKEEAYIHRISASIVHNAEALIRKDIHSRTLTLEGLLIRWEQSAGLPIDDRNKVTDSIYQAKLGYEVIARTDSSLNIRWLTPESGYEKLKNKDFKLSFTARSAMLASRSGDHIVVMEPFESMFDGKAFGITIPVHRIESDEFAGLVVGVLLFEKLFDDLFPADLFVDHNMTVFVNGELAYSNSNKGQPASQQWLEQGSFNFSDIEWRIDVTPHYELLSLTYIRLQRILLITGILLSLLAAATVYLVMTFLERMRTSHATSHQLELLMKNLPGMAYQGSTADGWPMTFVSDGCELLTGYSKKDFESRKLLFGELIHAADHEAVRESVRRAVQEGKPFEFEYRIRTKNQQERWVWERGRASTGVKQGGALAIEGFIIDVTERKLADIALSQNQAFSEAVLDTVEEGIITFDSNGDIETANSAIHKLFGYNTHELRGHNIDTLIPSVNLTELFLNPDNFKSAGSSDLISFSRASKAKRNDGSMFPIYFWLSQIKGHTPKKFVGLIGDRSFRVEVKRENRRHTEQLAHIDRLNMLGEMAAGMAHEINQPLTAISLFAQAGKRLLEGRKYEQLPEVFEKLSGHALRAGDVIERMQSMAKPGEHHREVIDSVDMIRETAKLAEKEAHLLNIEIEITQEEDLPFVKIDRIQIQQVVLNLLRNALQSMSSQQIKHSGVIELQLKLNENGDLKVLIVDSGAGVVEDIMDTLFIPFSTSKKEGMGMGLSICQAIIIEHGGQLNFYNNKSDGATFFFTLPARSDDE
jgi:two-component system sensor kinase FixL